jgi:hypothetical protein
MYNIVNNYFKPGPETPKDSPIGYRILKPEAGRSKLDHLVFGRAYVSGNIMEGHDKVTKNNWDGGVQVEDLPSADKYQDDIKWNQPLPMPEFPIMSAKESFTYVLDNAGATLPKRDPVDTRVTTQVRTGNINPIDGVKLPKTQFEHRRLPIDSYKNGIITDVSQVGGYPEYKGTPYPDADQDGMPDDWENKVGLNPKDASDAQKDMSGDGYSNIEKFINGIDPKKKTDWKDPKNNHDTLASLKTSSGKK